MRYYFSSPACKPEDLVLQKLDAKNILLTFANLSDRWNVYTSAGKNIMLDSGAFSVWNNNRTMDIEKYKNFCMNLPIGCEIVCVSLDVIPGVRGKKPTDEEIKFASQKSVENYLYLKKFIKNLLPVFHYGEDFKILQTYMNETDYIGVSPANDTHENVKRRFLTECFSILKINYKTHAFGYSSASGMALFPFFSVDSISYKKATNEKRHTTFFATNSKLEFFMWQNVKKYLKLERELTELWNERGVNWENFRK